MSEKADPHIWKLICLNCLLSLERSLPRNPPRLDMSCVTCRHAHRLVSGRSLEVSTLDVFRVHAGWVWTPFLNAGVETCMTVVLGRSTVRFNTLHTRLTAMNPAPTISVRKPVEPMRQCVNYMHVQWVVPNYALGPRGSIPPDGTRLPRVYNPRQIQHDSVKRSWQLRQTAKHPVRLEAV